MPVMGMTADRDREILAALERIIHVDGCVAPLEGNKACSTCKSLVWLDSPDHPAGHTIGIMDVAIDLARQTLARHLVPVDPVFPR